MLGRGHEVFVENRVNGVGRRVAAEQAPQRQHLPERHAEGPDVDATVDRIRRQLLRRHVRERSLDLPGGGVVHALSRAGDSEVHHLNGAVVGHEEVPRRHVTMNDAEQVAVGVLELVCGVKSLRTRRR